LFLTDGIELQSGKEGEANWRVTGDELFFKGHFPTAPIVPGVLIAEAMAQLCGLILFGQSMPRSLSAENEPLVPARLAQVDVRFTSAVTPPASLRLRSRLLRDLGDLRLFDVEAQVLGQVVARGQLTLVVSAAAHESGDS